MKGLARLIPALLLVAPMAAGAQAAPQCEPDQGKPQFVARAFLSFSRAVSAVNQDADPTNDLREVLRILTDPRARDRNQNVVGQQYTAGQTYILLLSAGQPEVVRRGDIGIQTDPDATIDLALAADSMFRAVVTAHPECAELISQWRQHRPWLTVINQAINALNADQLDSAVYYAERSMILDRDAPYAYNVLALVAKERKQDSLALSYFQQALDKAGTDTTYADVRAKTLGDLARMHADRVQDAPAAQKAAAARQAIAAYQRYFAEPEVEDMARGFALNQLASLYVIAGDSAGLRTIYAPLLANPDQYGERALLEAGVVASRANNPADAARLFDIVQTRNAYQRDALYNLAAAQITNTEAAKALPVIRRVIELDPNNPDNYMLYAYAYSGLLNTTRDAALRRAYTDSLVKYNTMSEQMPIKVVINEFSRLRDSTTVGGTVENKGRAARSFTVQVELLGRNGEVLGTQEATVGPVGTGQSSSFRVTFPVAGDSAAGYRYKPITS